MYRKLRLVFLTILILTVFLFSACGDDNKKKNTTSGGGSNNNSSSQQKIVVTGASTIARGDWSSYFGIPIDNKAVGGIESTGLKNTIEGQVASKPDKIFISIGTNNILNRHEGVLIDDIDAIIVKIKAVSPTTKIYFMSMLPVRDAFSCSLIEIYNGQIESKCNSRGVKFISVYSLFKTSSGINETYYQLDGIHLTSDGYWVYANAIRSYVLS
jgi:lysophospholipase L1-like esterase